MQSELIENETNGNRRYICPCCGYRTLTEPPGSYDICPVCYWEDDPIQRQEPDYAGGANVPSLLEARENYKKCGVSETRFADKVRAPYKEEEVDTNDAAE